MLDKSISHGAARAGDEIQRFLGNAGLIKDVDEFRGDRRRIAGRLEHHGVAGDKRRGDQPGHDGAREIPRRNDHTDAERNIDKIVALAANRRELLGLTETQHFAAVEFEEIDGFGDVGVGFRPSARE